MGYVGPIGSERPSAAARPQTGRIGTTPLVSGFDATLIEPATGPGAPWRFGPEVPIERRQVVRDFARRDAGELRLRSVPATEFRIGVDLRRLGIAPGARLFVGEMPLGQRRVHVLRLQNYATRLGPVVFEDLGEMEAPFDTPQARAEANDAEAAAALGQHLARSPFVSDRVLSASLAGIAAPFVSYEDEGRDSANKRRDASWSVGLVADAEAARDAVMAYPPLRSRYEASGAGRMRLRIGAERHDVALPPEISDKAPIHLALAVAQALCGAGRHVDEWKGRAVGDYACTLFEQHVLAAVRRRDGDLLPTLGWPEGFEPMDEDGLEWRPGLEGEVDPEDPLGLPRARQ